MKNILTAALLIIAFSGSLAQTVQLENLHTFDKLVVKGKVKTINAIDHHSDRPEVTIEGVTKDDVSNRIEAGVLYLEIKGNEPVSLTVSNRNLNRIETDNQVEILGADIVGDNGRYLIASFNSRHDHLPRHLDINIPKIDIDLPGLAIDIPEMDFDFDHNFDHDFDFDTNFESDSWNIEWDWEDHKEEMKHVGQEVREEVKRAMEEVKRELKRHKREH